MIYIVHRNHITRSSCEILSNNSYDLQIKTRFLLTNLYNIHTYSYLRIRPEQKANKEKQAQFLWKHRLKLNLFPCNVLPLHECKPREKIPTCSVSELLMLKYVYLCVKQIINTKSKRSAFIIVTSWLSRLHGVGERLGFVGEIVPPCGFGTKPLRCKRSPIVKWGVMATQENDKP